MNIDRARALNAFETYVSAYDAGNARIALKVEHTLHVAALCERIARSAGMVARDVDLAWLCGLLHDFGRFEQVRRWGTFSDAASTSHAALGVQVLFGGTGDPRNPADAGAQALASSRGAGGDAGAGVIGWFAEERDEDGLIRAAVANHSAFRLPAGLDARTRAFCDIVRDADKVDILRAACTCDREAIFGRDEAALLGSRVSPAVERAFYEHRCVRREEREYPADIALGFACFAFELVYDESARAAAKQGYALELLELPFERPDTQATAAAMRTHLKEWLAGRLG